MVSPPQEDGGGTVSRDAQSEKGDHGPADAGVVGGLRSDDAVYAAGAELLWLFAGLLGHRIGDDVGGGASHPRQHPDGDADDNGPNVVKGLAGKIRKLEPQAPELVILDDLGVVQGGPGAGVCQDVGHGEHPHHNREVLKAQVQGLDPKGKADGAAHRGYPHHGDNQAQHCGGEALGSRFRDEDA